MLNNTTIKILRKRIKALQQKNNDWQNRYYTLDAGHSRLFKDFCKLQQKIAQLQAQVTQMRKALTVANNYMPDVGHFCTCGKCKKCGTNINYADYGYCLKCARNIIDAALSNTPETRKEAKQNDPEYLYRCRNTGQKE
jgi:hypothetical protein